MNKEQIAERIAKELDVESSLLVDWLRQAALRALEHQEKRIAELEAEGENLRAEIKVVEALSDARFDENSALEAEANRLKQELQSSEQENERLRASALEGKYGEYLSPFINLMDKELNANSGKGDRAGWLSMSPDVAMLEIYYHAAKLQKAVKDGDLDGVKEYSADVANMSMMLLDVCGGLVVDKALQAEGGEG